MKPSKNPEPRACDARRCLHCRFTDQRGIEHVRPISPADMAWQFGEADSALGIRSTHGAFVDMAQSGVQMGGKSNGTENRIVHVVRLAGEPGHDPVAKHRCIRTRLAHVAADDLEVLRAAFGPEDWTRSITDPDVRTAIEQAMAGVPVEVARALPLTEAAQAHAARRQAPVAASGSPVVVYGPLRTGERTEAGDDAQDRERGVRCAYRPPAPPPRRKRARKSDPGTAPPSPAERLKRHFAEQPGLAGTAQGHVMSVALAEDRRAFFELVGAARRLVSQARAAAGVVDPPRRARTKSVRHHMPAPAEMLFASEVA